MALTVTLTNDGRITGGGFTAQMGTIDFDDSYPTGGESFAATDIGLNRIDMLFINQRFGYTYEWDSTNDKILVYMVPEIGSTASVAGAALVEASSTKDLTAASGIEFIAWGG